MMIGSVNSLTNLDIAKELLSNLDAVIKDHVSTLMETVKLLNIIKPAPASMASEQIDKEISQQLAAMNLLSQSWHQDFSKFKRDGLNAPISDNSTAAFKNGYLNKAVKSSNHMNDCVQDKKAAGLTPMLNKMRVAKQFKFNLELLVTLELILRRFEEPQDFKNINECISFCILKKKVNFIKTETYQDLTKICRKFRYLKGIEKYILKVTDSRAIPQAEKEMESGKNKNSTVEEEVACSGPEQIDTEPLMMNKVSHEAHQCCPSCLVGQGKRTKPKPSKIPVLIKTLLGVKRVQQKNRTEKRNVLMYSPSLKEETG